MTTTMHQPSTSEISNSRSEENVANGGDSIAATKNNSDDTNGTNESTSVSIEGTTNASNKDETDEKKTEEITEEMKLKYANWPYRDIKEPHANDVLYGRGGTFVFVALNA